MATHPILSDRFLVKGADGSPSSENWVQTILAEEVSTLCLHRVPHCEQTDWTLMPLQERADKFCLVPWHLLSTSLLQLMEDIFSANPQS